jgi:cysteine desulfurase
MPGAYLDNNATTPVDPAVLEEMLPYLGERFGNASSIHTWGQKARAAVEEARERVAELIGANTREILFTCGGTEADNTAILGVAEVLRPRGRHIVTSLIEHPAVLRACDRLEEIGFEVTRLPAGTDGRVDAGAAEAALRPDTVLVSLMYVNNETGVIQPVREVAELCRQRGIVFHTDAVQAVGKLPVRVGDLGVDLLSISAHKLHGPKGVGALYVREGVDFRPFLLGGGHERNRRGGTENVPGIVGLGRACVEARRHLEDFGRRVARLRDRLEAGLLAADPAACVNGTREHRVPHVTNLSFVGLEGETVLVALDFLGIGVSTGAACASGSVSPSHVLTGMGLDRLRIQGAIRFSLSRMTTDEEIDYVLEAAPGALKRIRETSFSRVVHR